MTLNPLTLNTEMWDDDDVADDDIDDNEPVVTPGTKSTVSQGCNTVTSSCWSGCGR